MTRPTIVLLHDQDKRALRLSLAALARQSLRPARVAIVIEATERALPPPRLENALGFETEILRGAGDEGARNAMLDAASGARLALLMREGIVPAPDALARIAARFEGDPDLAGLLLVTRRTRNINELAPADADGDDPHALLAPAAPARRPASLYFAPALLALSPAACREARFEHYAMRSDWAAYRLFLDQLGEGAKTAEEEASSFGYIGSRPDRRGGYAQGQAAAEELYRLAEAYPAYRERARRDLRALVLEQLAALASPVRARTARAFLAGMGAKAAEERLTARRLAADVARQA